jgi:small basic protein (TIGR04137 family)
LTTGANPVNFRDQFLETTDGEFTMSMHSSLKGAAKIRTRRNVLKRFERVDVLKKSGKWQDGDRAHGLPKTKPED